jgi:threonine/homoserine/homoserine lactone efflux protein
VKQYGGYTVEFLLIASAHLLALLSPGPDFFLIMQASFRLPCRYGIAICAGIAMANGAYLLLAVLGLEAVREMTWLLLLLRYLGAAYLLFLGVMLLRAPRQSLEKRESSSFLHVQSIVRQFIIGFMSAILNPKNAIFYLSLFTVMVSEQTGFPTRCLYALWMMSVVFFWDCSVVLVIGHNRFKKRLGSSIYYIEKISGATLIFFGIFLPFT